MDARNICRFSNDFSWNNLVHEYKASTRTPNPKVYRGQSSNVRENFRYNIHNNTIT